MFDDDFIHSLPEDCLQALRELCLQFAKVDKRLSPEEKVERHGEYIEALGAFEAFMEANEIALRVPGALRSPEMSSAPNHDVAKICHFVEQVATWIDEEINKSALTGARERFRMKFGVGFVYEFSDGDLNRIQILVNELRELVTESELFAAEHKERVLRKLEALQREMHKKMRSLDKIWGFIGEAGVVVGKFGKDAKPFVDRVREIAQIGWRTQARAEELPSGTTLPLLTKGEESESV